MKNLLLLLFSIATAYAQSSANTMYSITYLNSFKDRISANNPVQEYSRLLVKGDESIYQMYNTMTLDTLRLNGKLTNNDINKYFSFTTHTVTIKNNTITFRDAIDKDEYTYQETAKFNWVLGDKTKTIKGYQCNNATTTYGGRDWEAWYCLDLPINAGPYKFKGLPGLILNITDSTKSYDFSFYAIVERPLQELKKLSNKSNKEINVTDRATFNRMAYNYEMLSLGEKINYTNTGKKLKVLRVDASESIKLRDPNKIKKSKDINLIELKTDN